MSAAQTRCLGGFGHGQILDRGPVVLDSATGREEDALVYARRVKFLTGLVASGASSRGSDDERLLIDQHWDYGARVHDEVAEVLTAALGDGTHLVRGHALFIRLYQEQIAALEDFGAWAWALRERHTDGFLTAYLRYQVRDLRKFWEIVSEHDADLPTLLQLPSQDEIATALDAYPETTDTLTSIFDKRLTNLRQGAAQFFATDEIVIRVYNKLKHGIPIIRRDESNPRMFEVLVLSRGVRTARFELTGSEIQKLHRNTLAWSVALRDLAGLTKVLHDGGILYGGPPALE